MGTLFGESFDEYAPATFNVDMATTGLYSLITTSGVNLSANTPFGVGQSWYGGQAFYDASSVTGTFATASNETTVYGSLRINVNHTNAANYFYLTFNDGVAAQVTIRWHGDGSIQLCTGANNGILVQSYAAQFAALTWTSFQFKIVIDSTAGSIELRRSGGTANVVTKTGMNTRGGTSTAQVNGFIFGTGPAGQSFAYLDDFFLTNIGWTGDLRCLQQAPITTVQSQFTVYPTTLTQPILSQYTNTTIPGNIAFYFPYTPSVSATLASLVFFMSSNFTGNVKFALFDSNGSTGGPGTVLATSNVVTNPTTPTPNTATFASVPSLMGGHSYYLSVCLDGSANFMIVNVNPVMSSGASFASYPTANPVTSMYGGYCWPYVVLTLNPLQAMHELIEDGDTTYVYASSIAEDRYSLSTIPTTYLVTAVQYYACWKKPDAGARTAVLSVAAHGSADTALVTDNAIPSSYSYRFKTLDVDPTSAPWTPANVNGAIVGVAVTA